MVHKYGTNTYAKNIVIVTSDTVSDVDTFLQNFFFYE